MAAAELSTALFVRSAHSGPTEMTLGVHKALIGLGILTIGSTMAFKSLKPATAPMSAKRAVYRASANRRTQAAHRKINRIM